MQRFYDALNVSQAQNDLYFTKLARLMRLSPAHLNRVAMNLYWNEWS